jgi:TRAP-type C4-dicarboxylate transport system permease small subunit
MDRLQVIVCFMNLVKTEFPRIRNNLICRVFKDEYMKIKTLSWIFHHIPELIGGIALTCAITITVVNAFCRYAFGFTYAGSDELVIMGFGWTVFPGAAAAFRRKMHMGIDVLINIFPETIRRITEFCLSVFIVIINAYLTFLGFYLATHAWQKIMPATRIPYFYLDMAFVVGFAFMTWYSILNVYESIIFLKRSAEKTGNEKEGGAEPA